MADFNHDDPIANELERFSNSNDTSQIHLCAIGEAMREVIKEQGLSPSPTAYFASTISALERELLERNDDAAIASMLKLLSIVVSKTPLAVLRLKNDSTTALVIKISNSHRNDEEAGQPITKSAISCLQYLLLSEEKSNWGKMTQGFEFLIQFCIDHRPKVRKHAQSTLVDVFAEFQGTPALTHASELLASFSENQFISAMNSSHADSKPSNQIKSKSKSDSDQGHPNPTDASDAGTKAAVRAFHVLGMLKHVIFLLSEKSITRICARLIELHELQQPVLTRHVLETLHAVFRSPTAHVSSFVLSECLNRLIDSEEKYGMRKRDVDELKSVAYVTQSLLERFHAVDPSLCATKLPFVFHTFCDHLASEQEEVVFICGEFLKTVITNFVDESMVEETLKEVEKEKDSVESESRSGPTQLEKIFASVQKILQYQFCTAWDISLLLVASLFEKIGKPSHILLKNILHSLDELQKLPDSDMKCRKQLHTALGSAVQAMGMENFLNILPLEMSGPDLSTSSRVWMIPILKQYCVGSSLKYFFQNLLPIAAKLRANAKKAEAENKPITAKNLEACVYAIWSLFPATCNYCIDTSQNFSMIAKVLGDSLSNENTLRPLICLGIQILIFQNKQAAVGDSFMDDDLSFNHLSSFLKNEFEETCAEQLARESLTADVAAANLKILSFYSKNFLPVLFNAFFASPPEKRSDLHLTLAAFASISSASRSESESESKSQLELKTIFKTLIQKLLKATQEAAQIKQNRQNKEKDKNEMQTDGDVAAESPNEKRCIFIDLTVSLIPGLDDEAVKLLWISIKPSLQDENKQVQKKSYKVLASLCKLKKNFVSENSDEILNEIVSQLSYCHSSSKKNRLVCIKYLILHLLKQNDVKKEEVVMTLITEIILATKEMNKKTRDEAYNVLVSIGREIQNKNNNLNDDVDDDDNVMNNNDDDNDNPLIKYFSLVAGGLAGKGHEMISASIYSLSRLLFEFSSSLMNTIPHLLPSILLLFRSKDRDVIKGSLGFVKVAIVRLPASEVERFLPNILESVLVFCEESQTRFRTKVRIILEKLIRRVGMNTVSASMPEQHKKLLTHIRKTNERAQKKKRSKFIKEKDEIAKSEKSRMSTARKSAWNHTDIFSDGRDGDDEEEDEDDMNSSRFFSETKSFSKNISALSSRKMKNRRLKTRLPEEGREEGEGEEGERERDTTPLDLLDIDKTRKALSAPFFTKKEDKKDDLMISEDGRLIITDEKDEKNWKRKRLAEEESDEDEEEKRSRKSGKDVKRSKVNKHGKHVKVATHSGSEYAVKKGKVAGDVKRDGKFEPYAYWPLDAKMLNKREDKKAMARQGMKNILRSGKGKTRTSNAIDGERKKFSKIKQKAHKGKGSAKGARKN